MDDLIDDLTRIALRCNEASTRFNADPQKTVLSKLGKAAGSLGDASSGSWIGYFSRIYTVTLRPVGQRDFFDSQFGNHRGGWAEYSYETILNKTFERAGVSKEDFGMLADIANGIQQEVSENLRELLPTLDAILSMGDDATVREKRDALRKMPTHVSASEIASQSLPKHSQAVTDMRALQEGPQTPPHIGILAHLVSLQTTAYRAREVAEAASYLKLYLQKAMKMKGKSVAKTDGPIFIGHGHSPDWKELKDFLHDRLHLDHQEFNREPTAGLSNKERLTAMLDKCPFAFLVMTAEDEQADGTFQARMNVVHEAGLFQGRYGFERAIIMLEEGCKPFSNVDGIGQLRFEKGNISGLWEDVRRVLERERMI
jgi:predicted nucleotide-binding protein